MTARPPLVVEGLSKRFRTGGRTVEALVDVNFELVPGQVTGLIGADGAGKTTLMRMAAALLLPDAGRVQVLGLDTQSDGQRVQASIGYMPQHFGLYEDLTVQENLDLYADLQGVPPAERPARYRELMHMTGLAPFTGRLAGRLSGGMKQKLGLACALVRPPPLLLLDEPTVGVDPVSRRELWAIVDRLVREAGTTVLLSTAYLDEAERCDRILLLHEGRLLGRESPAEFSRPLAGRSFMIGAAGLSRRALQMQLSARDDVLDAVILGDRVRVVTAAPGIRPPRRLGDAELDIEAVPPRFEDAFIARLSEVEHGLAPARTPSVRAAGEPAATGAVISVREVSRRFGNFYAVKGVSFEVLRGEVFGLLGANGAGKSTLFRMLCGLLPVSGGQATVAGVDLRTARAEARARIGYMAQKFSLYGDLSVAQNLAFFSRVYGIPRVERPGRVRQVVTELELEPVLQAPARVLPLGYRQRLALAAAIMHRPDILFLDEPTSGVDPLARREFWQRINTLAEAGVTVLVTTHFMEEAEYCDRMVIMAEGEILASGTPAEIRAAQRSAEQPNPTMEDAFIALIQQRERAQAA